MAVYVSSQRCISTALYQPTEILNLKYRVVFHLAMQTSILGLMSQLFLCGRMQAVLPAELFSDENLSCCLSVTATAVAAAAAGV